jgi:hypothetical protein
MGGGIYIRRTRMEPLYGLARLTLIQHSLEDKTFEVEVHVLVQLRYYACFSVK